LLHKDEGFLHVPRLCFFSNCYKNNHMSIEINIITIVCVHIITPPPHDFFPSFSNLRINAVESSSIRVCLQGCDLNTPNRGDAIADYIQTVVHLRWDFGKKTLTNLRGGFTTLISNMWWLYEASGAPALRHILC
ncbi:hypothetical protein ACJX0J_007924, partial [Zea mays]